MKHDQNWEVDTFISILNKLDFSTKDLVADNINEILSATLTSNKSLILKWDNTEGILEYLNEVCVDNKIRSLHQLVDYYRRKSNTAFGMIFINQALEAKEAASESFRTIADSITSNCSCKIEKCVGESTLVNILNKTPVDNAFFGQCFTPNNSNQSENSKEIILHN